MLDYIFTLGGKTKKQDHGRISTGTDGIVYFRPCLKNICHVQGLVNGRTGQIGWLGGGGAGGRVCVGLRLQAEPRWSIKAKELSIDVCSRENHVEMSTKSPSPESTYIKYRLVPAKKGHIGLCPTHLNQRGSGESPG